MHGQDTEPRKILNRDIMLIRSVFFLMQEIVSLEKRRIFERERMDNITQHLTGMPGGGGIPKGMDEAFASLSDLEDEHKQKVKQYTRELRHAESMINHIENPNMRTFVTLMYLDNVPVNEVRAQLNMTRWGFERARNAVEQAECMELVKWHDRYIMAADMRFTLKEWVSKE